MKLLSFLLLLITCPQLSLAQEKSSDPLPSAEQVVSTMVARNAERAARLHAYSSVRHYTLDYRGLPADKHATMTVRATFENGQKRLDIVEEDGSKLLRGRVLHKLLENEMQANTAEERAATALGPDNYSFQMSGTDTVAGRRCYVLAVTPRRPHRLLYVGRVWIDAEDYALARIEARPAKNPSFWIKDTAIQHQYGKFGQSWLPVRNHSISKIRLGGQAVLDIDYGTYDVSDR